MDSSVYLNVLFSGIIDSDLYCVSLNASIFSILEHDRQAQKPAKIQDGIEADDDSEESGDDFRKVQAEMKRVASLDGKYTTINRIMVLGLTPFSLPQKRKAKKKREFTRYFLSIRLQYLAFAFITPLFC